jgi:hypothetical protein
VKICDERFWIHVILPETLPGWKPCRPGRSSMTGRELFISLFLLCFPKHETFIKSL